MKGHFKAQEGGFSKIGQSIERWEGQKILIQTQSLAKMQQDYKKEEVVHVDFCELRGK